MSDARPFIARKARRAAFPTLGVVLALLGVSACAGGEDAEGGPDEGIVLADVGFQGPESVLHDTVADVYLVANINGEPTGEDDNGFISRVSPTGEVEELRWIDGSAPDVNLDAPKGMAIIGDSLFVADIRCVRVFDRVLGEQLQSWCKENAVFINDIAVGPNRELFVTETGREGGQDNQAGALYRFDLQGRIATLAQGPQLGRPNGIAVGPRGIFVVSFGSGEIAQFTAGGQRTPVVPPSERQLDGIVFLPDGGFLFSSWGDQAIYRVGADGAVAPIVEGVVSPADIEYDAQRSRVLIPLLTENRVLFRDVPR